MLQSGAGLAGDPLGFKIIAPRTLEENEAEEKCKRAKIIKFLLHGFVFRLKGEIHSSAGDTVKKMLFELAKAMDILPEKTHYSRDNGNNYLIRFIIAGFKSLQMRLKLNLGDAESFLEAILQNQSLVFGDVYDLIDSLGRMMEESEFLLWYDNVPWIHEFVTALHEFAFADAEIGLVHKNFSTSVRIETLGVRDLFDAAMMNMYNKN